MSKVDLNEVESILSDVAIQKSEPTNPALDEVIAMLESELSRHAAEGKKWKLTKFRAKHNHHVGAGFALEFALKQAKAITSKYEQR